MRYLLRPKEFSITPKELARRLGCERTYRYPTNLPRNRLPMFDPHRDFIMCWSNLEVIDANTHGVDSNEDREPLYLQLSSFYRASKRTQRYNLSGFGVKTPESYGDAAERYVVRPLRHSGGRHFRVTEDPEDYSQESEYISPLFPKTHEYRLVFCKGTHLFTLTKQVPEGTPNDVPWNHSQGSRFVTVSSWDRCRLRNTDVLDDLRRVPFLPLVHLVAVDVMYNADDRTYAAAEFNFAPSLTIEENLNKIVEFYNGS